MGGTGEIAIGAAGVALLLVGIVAVHVSRQRRWQRILWAFKVPAKERPKIIIETIAGKKTELYKRPTVGFGAVAAVAQLTTALNASRRGLIRRGRSLEHPVELSFSSEERADSWCSTADLVVVGGPKNNAITAAVMQAYGCQPSGSASVDPDELKIELKKRTHDLRPDRSEPALGLGVATQGNSIFWFGEEYTGSVGDRDEPLRGRDYNGKDYGVILRLPSPTTAAHRTVVVFGSQTFGVDAASLWLVKLRSGAVPRRTRNEMAKNKNVAVLVEADVTNGTLAQLELKDLVVLPDHLAMR